MDEKYKIPRSVITFKQNGAKIIVYLCIQKDLNIFPSTCKVNEQREKERIRRKTILHKLNGGNPNK